jgi:hypothetical protein
MAADDGVEKSAILLISLGEDYAAEVLKHLGPEGGAEARSRHGGVEIGPARARR